jgi:hypothetical protein
LLSLGWGAGLISKVAVADPDGAPYRAILKHVALYQKALQTSLPFPKTRRVVFEGGEPSQIPGWVLLEVV